MTIITVLIDINIVSVAGANNIPQLYKYTLTLILENILRPVYYNYERFYIQTR